MCVSAPVCVYVCVSAPVCVYVCVQNFEGVEETLGWDDDPVDVLTSLVFFHLSMYHHDEMPMDTYAVLANATPDRERTVLIPDHLCVIPFVSEVVRTPPAPLTVTVTIAPHTPRHPFHPVHALAALVRAGRHPPDQPQPHHTG